MILMTFLVAVPKKHKQLEIPLRTLASAVPVMHLGTELKMFPSTIQQKLIHKFISATLKLISSTTVLIPHILRAARLELRI